MQEKNARFYPLLMRFNYTVNDWNALPRNLVHSNISNLVRHVDGVGEEKKVATVKRRFH